MWVEYFGDISYQKTLCMPLHVSIYLYICLSTKIAQNNQHTVYILYWTWNRRTRRTSRREQNSKQLSVTQKLRLFSEAPVVAFSYNLVNTWNFFNQFCPLQFCRPIDNSNTTLYIAKREQTVFPSSLGLVTLLRMGEKKNWLPCSKVDRALQ